MFKSIVFSFIVLLGTLQPMLAQNKPASPPKQPVTAKEVDKLTPQDSYALPWEEIKESNIVWKTRVWRTIDVNSKGNAPLAYNKEIPDDYNLANILLQGVFNKQYKAYRGADDRFTTELSQEELLSFFAAGNKNKVANFRPENITRYRLKEDWMYLAAEKKVVVRILGIAPLYMVDMEEGGTEEQAMLWIYYPDIRKFMAAHPVYEGKSASDINWDQFFEGRKFADKIEQVGAGTGKGQLKQP